MASRQPSGTTPAARRKQPQQAPGILEQMPWMVFTALLVLRMVNALSVKTFFQPDEYFQSLEPAWQIAFGKDSGAWITWEWRERLRSAIHPWLFAMVYRTAEAVSKGIGASPAARAEVFLLAPKLLQATFAAVMDFYTWRLAGKVYESDGTAMTAALALTAVSPWQWYSSVRTFSNSLETTLTIAALYVWPWEWFLDSDATEQTALKANDGGASMDLKDFLEGKQPVKTDSTAQQSRTADHTLSSTTQQSAPLIHLALGMAAIACILRPTNAIVWSTICIALALKYSSANKTTILFQNAALTGSTILAMTLAIDGAYYKQFTLPPVNFLYFNVVQSLAVFYGRNRIDYYFTEGLPLLLTTALPFAAVGLWRSLRPSVDRPQFAGYVQRQTRFVLALTVVTSVLAFSIIAHKEMRFIYPLLPVLHVLAAKPLADFFAPFPMPKSYARLGLLLLGLTINVYIAAYVSLVHQRGVIDVTHYLRHEVEMPNGMVRNTTVGFFMPCHSTPWRSHLVHPEISAWALTCEPPLDVPLEYRPEYEDEADVFYNHPGGWIDEHMQDRKTVFKVSSTKATEQDQDKRAWPEYLVFFEHLEPVMNAVLEDTRYQECWRGFNTHWHDDGRRRGDVVVQCLR